MNYGLQNIVIIYYNVVRSVSQRKKDKDYGNQGFKFACVIVYFNSMYIMQNIYLFRKCFLFLKMLNIILVIVTAVEEFIYLI